MVQLSTGDPATGAYVERRRCEEGAYHREIVRYLKHDVLPEICCHLVHLESVPADSDLRAARPDACIRLQPVADALGSWPTMLAEVELGLTHDAALARSARLGSLRTPDSARCARQRRSGGQAPPHGLSSIDMTGVG